MKDNPKLYDLSRRKVLAGMGAVGASSVGAGLGTTAYFSDSEDFEDNRLTAGALDLKLDWEEHYYKGGHAAKYTTRKKKKGYQAFPTPEDPMVWVKKENVRRFMDATSIEAFPDNNNDGRQDYLRKYDPCKHFADTPEDLDSKKSLRTYNKDTYDRRTGKYRPLVALDDVKPGDFGEVTFSLHLCDNPGYIWMTGQLNKNAENGYTEPERKDPDEDGKRGKNTGELADTLRAIVWYDIGKDGWNRRGRYYYSEDAETEDHYKKKGDRYEGDNVHQKWEPVIAKGTLRQVLQKLDSRNGIPLDGNPKTKKRDCFVNSTNAFIGFAWWLPVDHGNEVQTDSVEFDLGFYTEQCRHNDGKGMRPEKKEA